MHLKRCVSMQPERLIVSDIFELVIMEKRMQVGEDSTERTLHITIYYIDIYVVWSSKWHITTRLITGDCVAMNGYQQNCI